MMLKVNVGNLKKKLIAFSLKKMLDQHFDWNFHIIRELWVFGSPARLHRFISFSVSSVKLKQRHV